MPGGTKLIDWIKPTLHQEAGFFNVASIPTDQQIALVISALRMHTIMVHAAQYDQSELADRSKVTEFHAIESSIGRYFRDVADLELRRGE